MAPSSCSTGPRAGRAGLNSHSTPMDGRVSRTKWNRLLDQWSDQPDRGAVTVHFRRDQGMRCPPGGPDAPDGVIAARLRRRPAALKIRLGDVSQRVKTRTEIFDAPKQRLAALNKPADVSAE